MKIKKKNINLILLTILTFDNTGKATSGLLTEEMSLGTKRKLQKIRNELLKLSTELNTDHQEVINKTKGNAVELDKEVNELVEEEVTLTCEPVVLSEIEKIKTNQNYDFDLIELISQ